MGKREETVRAIVACGVVPIIRVNSSATARHIADAIIAGGLPVLEVTLTTPGALEVIAALQRDYVGRCLIGAGSVINAGQARQAVDAGVSFLVSPNTEPAVLKVAAANGVASMPGALTPTEVVRAYDEGGDLIKIFPCDNVGGAAYIRALKAPLPQIPLVPTGGVTLANCGEFIRAGSEAVAVGSSLMDRASIEAGDWQAIAVQARQFAKAVASARGR